MTLCWLFGHEKKYVGVEPIVWKNRLGELPLPCPHGFEFMKNCGVCDKATQICRWICECGSMGQDFIREGFYKVEFGKLVPDEKGWGNYTTNTWSKEA